MSILVALQITEHQKDRLMAAAPDQSFVFCDGGDVSHEALEGAEIILGNIPDPQQIKNCQHLRWVHLSNAGVDDYLKSGILPEGVQLANGTGAYGPAISEYMVGVAFALKKKLHLYGQNQAKHLWEKIGQVPLIAGSTVLVIGLGDIGRCYARKMKALGCHVIGIKRRACEKPEWLDELYLMEDLNDVIRRADIVALSLPGTPATYHMMNAERIALMKETAVLINVGRGICVDTQALTQALYERRIGGAALDVLEQEPLDPDHPIWDAPNTIITPHISGRTMQPDTLDRLVDMFAENLRHDAAGESLQYLVDMATGYQR